MQTVMASTGSPKYLTASHVNITHNVTRWERLLHDVRAKASVNLRTSINGLLAVLQDRAIDPSADAIKELARVEKLAHGASAEVFANLYSGGVEALDSAAPDTEWVSAVHAQLAELPQFHGLVQNVSGDPDLAAVATAELLNAVVPLLPAMLDDEDSQNTDSKPSRRKGYELDAGQELRAMLGQACNDASKKAAEVRGALGGLAPGLDETPAAHEQDSADRLKLAEKLENDEHIRRAMLLAGRLRRVAASNRKERDPSGCDEVVGLTQGADLPRVLPSELAMMRNPATRMLQLAKLAERKLQQYDIQGSVPQGRGPIVVLLDESGSMRNHDRHTWATAVALACLGMAARETRPCTVIGFNAGIRYVYRLDADGVAWEHSTFDIARFDQVPGGCATIAMKVATSSPAGGTEFAAPVMAALELEDGVTKDRSDLVLVTDGHADLPLSIMDRLDAAKKDGLRVFGLTVGGGSVGKAVSHLCDYTAEIDNQSTKEVGNALP